MKKVVVTSFDRNYLEHSKVTLKSLGRHYHENDPLKVICLVPRDLLSLEKEYSASVNQSNLTIEFRASERFEQLLNDNKAQVVRHSSLNAYQRVFIGSTLLDYDMAIYLDPDTLVRRSFKPMLDYSSKAPFLAVVETVNMAISVFATHDIPYFNNGVFIADLNFWRSEDIEQKLLSWIFTNEKSPLAEQDAMNAVLGKYLGPLPFTFNFFDWTIENNKLMAEEFCDPLIVHFAGEEKPWKNSRLSRYGYEWRRIQSQMGQTVS